MACVNPTGALRANDVDKVHCRRNLAPEVGFEPTIRRGGLTADLWERLWDDVHEVHANRWLLR